MVETYKGNYRCSNCKWEGELDVPKGTTKINFTVDEKCPDCKTDKLNSVD